MPDLIEKIADGFGKCLEAVAGATATVANKTAYGLEWVALKCDPEAQKDLDGVSNIIGEVAADASQVQKEAAQLAPPPPAPSDPPRSA